MAEMEEKRVAEEQARMKAWEEAAAAASGGDPNATVVLGYDDEGLKLADGTEGITVPEDQKEALLEAIQQSSEAEGQAVLAIIDRENSVLKEFKVVPLGEEAATEEAVALQFSLMYLSTISSL